MRHTFFGAIVVVCLIGLSGCHGQLKPSPGHDPDGPGNSENTPSVHSD
jgi:hypothetical protein